MDRPLTSYGYLGYCTVTYMEVTVSNYRISGSNLANIKYFSDTGSDSLDTVRF